MSDSQESMEVTLQTEVESGASGFSVAGGGAEGIFVKQVLKESPASNLFSLREGDQLLSATIFFDNIKYEDALKILQYSEPYKIQFNLKRKLVGKDELEAMHSATQSKKEKLSQGMDTMEISEKTISEEDKANLIVKQRVGRPKRTKKDRLSWPKFQSIKGKKILGHRRSRSTSDAYEHGIPDVSPTSTDTESQFQPEEIHGKIKKQSQKKLKFPTIGFKMHKSKQEPYEINPFKEYENGTAVELSDIMTREYTSLDGDRKPKEKEPKRGVSDAVFPLPQHTKKYPDVELTLTKSKEKKLKSNIEFTKQEPTVTTTQMKTAVIQTKDITDSQIKVSQNIPKMRKKKQKDSKVQIETQYQKEEKGKETNIASKYALPQTEASKVEMDIKIPKMDFYIPKADHKATKPEHKMGEITADINIPEFDIKSTAGQGILELKTTGQETNITSDEIPADGSAITLEDDETKFKMLKLQMPTFGISRPKQKVIPQGELSISPMETDFPKTGLKTELKTAEIEADIKLTEVEIKAPSLDVEIGEKVKIKMPEVKVPRVKVAKLKAPEVGISLPKVEPDVTLPTVEMSDSSAAIKLPEAEGTIEGGGLKIHMPKFKMPSMGFSKPDIKGPKVDVDDSMPKVDISLPEAELHIDKPEVKGGDITISAPEVKIPTGSSSLELKAPEVDLEAPSGKVSVQGPDVKLESGDRKFQMPKFHMPKFGMSLPKGKGVPEAEITVPSVEAELPKTGLKAEVTLPSAELEADLKLPKVEVDAPSLDVEIGDAGKIKMPEVKVPSVKVPKLKGPEVGISLPKVETDVTLPKGKAVMSDAAVAIKLPEAEGTIDGGGLKIHMPKFKMPSIGFSKPDIKGPKIDVDVSMPKVDVSLPKAELHIEKTEVKGGDITISAPEVKIPTGSASLELKAPKVDVEAPSGKVSVQGPDVKLESGDRKFQMPKFHMPKFGMSLPKGKGVPEAEISVPSVEAELPKTALKAEVSLPSAELEADLKLPKVEVDAPSLDVEIGDAGKIKMPEVKVPSVKVPKLKGPEVGISLPKVETDVTLPKGKAEVSDAAVAIKLPEAEGTIDGGGLKIHMPKFKMPHMGFSKPDIKGPKIDVDFSIPKADISRPEVELHVKKPEVKGGDITISAPEVKIPTGSASLELKASEIDVEAPSGKVSVQGPDVKLESGDSKFHVPQVGISRPKGKVGEVTILSMEGDLPKTGLKMEITLPSSEVEADITLPEVDREAPSLDVEVEEKGKIKTPRVKLPSVKPPKFTAPEVGISLPKVEADVSLSKGKAELPDSEAASKVAEAESSREKGRMKIHMPKFKMPSMGFSKSDNKGPKIDSDASMPDVHTSLPKVEVSTTKPHLKKDEFEGDIRIAAPEVKIPWVPVTVELQAPDVEVQASSGKVPDIAVGLSKDVDVPQLKTTTDIIDIAVEATTFEMESDVLGEKKDVLEQKIKMPQIIRADVKTAAVGIPSVDISVTESEVSIQDLHGTAKEPEAKGQITKRGSLDGEEKGHFKMPKFKLPSLSWSPKKEASLKTNIKEPLEESHLGIVSDDMGTEPKVTLSEDQGVHIDGNVDIATKKGQVKRHLSMPKISLSKTKLPKAEVDIVVEGDGALVQIPDIESSFTTRKVEETEISVKMLKGEIKEIKTFQADTDISLPKPDIKVSMTKSSFEQECLETELKGDICMDSASMKFDGTEGEFRMPKLKMPKFGISDLSESEISDLSGSGITLSKPESDASQLQMTTESDELGGKAQPLQVKSDEEISDEIQTEESQSWFKMPKFKMPSFGRTSKAKKSDAETEDITGEAHATELQVEVRSPEVVTISRELDTEKKISEQKVMLPQEDVRVQKEQQFTTDQLVSEGSFLQSSEIIGRKPSDLEPKTYADIVKDGAEGYSSQTEFTGTIPKMDIDRNIPKSEMTIQQPEVIPDTVAVAEIPSTEITMGKKIDAIIADPEPLQSLDTQPEEMGTEKKSPKKDSQGKESIFKMPTFSVPLFGWSTTKSNAIVPGIESDLEEPAVTLSKVKMDVSITDEDFEIIDFPVEGFEKDLPKEGEVKAEEKTSKTKASKFKMPKFANLRSKSQGVEIQVDSPKVQTEVSLVRPEEETSEIQVQDKKPGDAEESFQMPKFKMLKFTHRISEGEKLTSEETMDIKDTADDDISQLQFKTMFPEEKRDDIQKSKVRITTLSEPAIQRPQVGSKFQSTDSSFVDTTVYVHKQVPKEFSAEFLKEKIETMDGNVQKSIAKITTLKEPDIQRAPLEVKLQPDDPFSSSAPVQVKGSITESKEIRMESKSTFGCGDDAEIQESFSTQIVKESEIPPSEVKTAAFGFSLLKVKIQESHVSLDVPVKLSSTKCMGEIFEDKDHQLSGTGEAAQKAGLSEVKPSDKDITYEYIEGTSSATTLTTLKSFTVDIQSSSEFAESHSELIEISKSAIETAEETAFASSTDEVTDEKDSKRSGRFKLWFPSIGFSPTTDDTTSDSKPEAQPKVQPDDSSKLDSDTAKETEKTGWFKFPKLGFSSPTKKSKEVGKEKETDSKEGKGEESPTDKNETFFDAQETLSLKEKEENETSGDMPSEPIVSSSARTELILLEKGKAKPKHTPEDSSK